MRMCLRMTQSKGVKQIMMFFILFILVRFLLSQMMGTTRPFRAEKEEHCTCLPRKMTANSRKIEQRGKKLRQGNHLLQPYMGMKI